MIARIRAKTEEEQTIKEHSEHVAQLAAHSLAGVGLSALGQLAGLLHDMGKYTRAFYDYIWQAYRHPEAKPPKGTAPHAQTGAIYAYERWYCSGQYEKLTAQILSLVIRAHHSGLPDCICPDGSSPYLECMEAARTDARTHYDEAKGNFLANVCGTDALDSLFLESVAEVRAFAETAGKDKASYGYTTRVLLSTLVDADRWDSACFERGENPFGAPVQCAPAWGMLLSRLNESLRKFDSATRIAEIRNGVSLRCFAAAHDAPGIYRLTVPTGGGKTLASLRFALEHARMHDMRRIFYVIPFNTILDQNAGALRDALQNYEGILEHHSNVVMDDEAEQSAHTRLAERWDSDIILTSFVHFMNTLYRKENTDARRMHRLQRSVIIFDEVQAIPQNCIRLFERAVQFLVRGLGCTAVLCTATQPSLALEGADIIQNAGALFQSLRRTEIIDETRPARTCEEAAQNALSLLREYGAVLMIVNTKKAAESVCQKVKDGAPANVHCFHLSTNMCPAHRMETLEELRALLKNGASVFLISTSLIEAGVDVSFPIVIRSFAGLPSILQAAGRCNRNGEQALGRVYVWTLSEEKLERLPFVQHGQALTADVMLMAREERLDLQDLVCIRLYFDKEQKLYGAEGKRNVERSYPFKNTNLVELLGKNKPGKDAMVRLYPQYQGRLFLKQAFRTAGEAFRVIPENTVSVIVPYGEGRQLLARLLAGGGTGEMIMLLRKLQRYTVNLYETAYRALLQQGGLCFYPEYGVTVLREAYYSGETGVTAAPETMDSMIY